MNKLDKTNNRMFYHEAIKKYFSEKRDYINKNKNTKEYKEEDAKRKILNDQMVAFCKNFIENNKICKANVDSNITGLNTHELLNKLSTDFPNHNFMECVRCSIDLILDKSDGVLSERDRINEWIRNPKRFGDESANGVAIRSSIIDKPYIYNGDTVVMKCPRNVNNSYELLIEHAIGLVLNDLRKKVINFSYVYGSYTGTNPIVDPKTKKIVLFNNGNSSKDDVVYALYENIDKSISIGRFIDIPSSKEELLKLLKYYSKFYKIAGDLIRGDTLETFYHSGKNLKEDVINLIKKWKTADVLHYLLQSVVSSKYAFETKEFGHNDLHPLNVLLRFCEVFSKSYIHFPYIDDDGVERSIYIFTPEAISTFIDYGMAHVKTETRTPIGKIIKNDISSIPTQIKSSYDIYADRSNAIGDIYKLICGLLLDAAKNDNKYLFSALTELISVFFLREDNTPPGTSKILTEEEIIKILKEQSISYYYLPYSSEFDIPMEKIVILLVTIIDRDYNIAGKNKTILYERPDNTIGCEEFCKTIAEYKKELNFAVTKTPTFFEVYDARTRGDVSVLIKNLNDSIDNAIILEEKEYKDILVDEETIYHMTTKMNIINYIDLLLSSSIFIAKMYNSYKALERHVAALAYIISIKEFQHQNKVLNIFKAMSNKYKSYESFLLKYKLEISYDIKTLKAYESNRLKQELEKHDEVTAENLFNKFKELEFNITELDRILSNEKFPNLLEL